MSTEPDRAALKDKAQPIVSALRQHLEFLKKEVLPPLEQTTGESGRTCSRASSSSSWMPG